MPEDKRPLVPQEQIDRRAALWYAARPPDFTMLLEKRRGLPACATVQPGAAGGTIVRGPVKGLGESCAATRAMRGQSGREPASVRAIPIPPD